MEGGKDGKCGGGDVAASVGFDTMYDILGRGREARQRAFGRPTVNVRGQSNDQRSSERARTALHR